MKLTNAKQLWLGAFCVFLLDQISKFLAIFYLQFDKEWIINNSLSLHLIYNSDTIMLNYSLPFGVSVEAFRIIYILQAFLIAWAIYWVTTKEPLKSGGWVADFSKVGLFIILGSLWGNAFDRIFRQEGVVDFIRLNMFIDSIPIVNIADIMLYVGELNLLLAWVILIISSLTDRYKKFKASYI